MIQNENVSLKNVDLEVIGICLTVTLSMTFLYYFSGVSFAIHTIHAAGWWRFATGITHFMYVAPNHQLHQLIYWAASCTIFYTAGPILLIKFIFKKKLTDYGLSFKNSFHSYRAYFAMMFFMVPLLYFVSQQPEFQSQYPFYKASGRQADSINLLIWEFFYLLQIAAVEFFFRGFMIHGMKHVFGLYSVFVMVIPYNMIHFGKPLPESLGSIVAGIILGLWSFKTTNIMLGVAIHTSVALTMDLFSLYWVGYFNQY